MAASDKQVVNVLPQSLLSSISARYKESQAAYKGNRELFSRLRPELQKLRGVADVSSRPPHISRRFNYSPADGSAAARAIRPQFIEPLVQQAASFVNRVLAEEPSYRQLIVDQTNLSLDLDEFQALDEINSDEVAAGLFRVPFWEASAGLISDNTVKTEMMKLADWVRDAAPMQKQFAGWSAENGHIPAYTSPQGLSKFPHTSLNVGKVFDKNWAQFNVPGNLPAGMTGDEGWIIGGMLAYAMADYSFSYQEKQLRSNVEPITQRNEAVAARTSYLDVDSGFRERRKVVAHAKLVAKLDAMQRPNGPLNYADRIAAIEERAMVDLREAYTRMRAVAKGMLLVYGIEAPDLPYVPKSNSDKINEQLLQQMVTWLRSVGLTLSDIAARDQEVNVSLSLRRLLPTKFEAMRGKARWEFEVDPARFIGLKYVRLRGLSVEVDSEKEASYSLVVSAPVQSAYIYQVGQAAVPIQQVIGDCWIGRTRPHASPREPDVIGGRVLLNASPIGKWTIAAAPEQNGVSEVSDIRVHLHLIAQTG